MCYIFFLSSLGGFELFPWIKICTTSTRYIQAFLKGGIRCSSTVSYGRINLFLFIFIFVRKAVRTGDIILELIHGYMCIKGYTPNRMLLDVP